MGADGPRVVAGPRPGACIRTVELEGIEPSSAERSSFALRPFPRRGSSVATLPGQVEWISPEAGEEVRGQIDLIGTVDVPSLGFYKYEYSQPGSDAWMTIAGGNQPTTPENNLLGEWNTSQLVPGDYLLRLVVMDNQNVAFPVCIIPIRVLAPNP